MSPVLSTIPVVHISADTVLFGAVALPNLAFELLRLPQSGRNRVREFAPLLFHLTRGGSCGGYQVGVLGIGARLLAIADPGTRDTYLKPGLLAPVTAHTITDSKILADQLRTIAQQRYSVDEEEFSLGLLSPGPFRRFRRPGRARSLPNGSMPILMPISKLCAE